MRTALEKPIALMIAALVAGGLIAAAASGLDHGASAAVMEPSTQRSALPAPSGDAAFTDTRARASVVFAGGCFWGVQGVFQHTRGVSNAVSGYIGGSPGTATYHQVSGGRTGHAEAVKVDYDPRQISYGQLLQVFFSVAHDPTQRNRQGPDHGTQYRSAIFSDDPRQQAANRAYVAQLGAAASFSAPIVTELGSGQRFHPAEAYHQNYMADHPEAAYIRYYDAPKLAALRSQFPGLYRKDAWRVPMKP